jgi:hypothetical protein
VLFNPDGSGFSGYLRSIPRRGDALTLRSGMLLLETGIRFAPDNMPAAAHALDELLYDGEYDGDASALPVDGEAHGQHYDDGWNDDAASALQNACSISSDERSVTCGTCTATRHTVAWTPPTLGPVTGNLAARSGIELDTAARADLQLLRDAAVAAGTITLAGPLLRVTSGYRSYNYDAGLWKTSLHRALTDAGAACGALWPSVEPTVDRTTTALAGVAMPHGRNAWADRWVQELASAGIDLSPCGSGNSAANARALVRTTRRWKAVPGTSAHTSGRAVDLTMGIRNTRANAAAQRQLALHQWLVCNAAHCNFHPYPVEPWHWEHVP